MPNSNTSNIRVSQIVVRGGGGGKFPLHPRCGGVGNFAWGEIFCRVVGTPGVILMIQTFFKGKNSSL